MSDLVLTQKTFQLIHFLSPGKQPKTRSVDITLLKWIRFDKNRNKFVSKYMPEPYTDERTKYLYNLIKSEKDAPNDWKEYTIQIVGHADTFEQGVERLNVLKFQEFACTTDSQISAKDKIAKLEKHLKEKTYDLESALNAPTLKNTNFGLNQKTETDPIATEDSDSEIDLFDVNKNKTKSHKFKNPTNDNEDSDSETGLFNFLKRKRNKSKTKNSELSYSDSEIDLSDSSKSKTKKLKTKVSANTSEYSGSETSPFDSDENKITSKVKNATKNKEGKKHMGGNDIMGSKNNKSDQIIEQKSMAGSNKGISSMLIAKTLKRTDKKNKIYEKNSKQKFQLVNKSKFNALLNDVRKLRADVKEILDNQKSFTTMLEINNSFNFSHHPTFEEEFDVELPLENLDKFKDLEEKLKTNEECYRRFKASLDFLLINDVGLRKCLVIIFKKYFKRELIIQFTAVKKVSDKQLFKDFTFCSCLLDLVCRKFQISQEVVLSEMGTVFGNAKDWEGHRKKR